MELFKLSIFLSNATGKTLTKSNEWKVQEKDIYTLSLAKLCALKKVFYGEIYKIKYYKSGKIIYKSELYHVTVSAVNILSYLDLCIGALYSKIFVSSHQYEHRMLKKI